jgi:hypothetical protein
MSRHLQLEETQNAQTRLELYQEHRTLQEKEQLLRYI